MSGYGISDVPRNPVHPGDHWENPPVVNLGPGQITISDVIRLAQAGVTINLNEIAAYIIPDPPPSGPLMDCSPMLKPLLQRWKRFKDLTARGDVFQVRYPFHLSAWSDGNTVHIFVCPTSVKMEPVILTDEALVYPSDTLLAKLHLLVETQPSTGVEHPNTGQTATAQMKNAAYTPPPQSP